MATKAINKRPPWKFTPAEGISIHAIWPVVVESAPADGFVPTLIQAPGQYGFSRWLIPIAAFSKLPSGAELRAGEEFLLVCYRYNTDEPGKNRNRLWPMADDWCPELREVLS